MENGYLKTCIASFSNHFCMLGSGGPLLLQVYGVQFSHLSGRTDPSLSSSSRSPSADSYCPTCPSLNQRGQEIWGTLICLWLARPGACAQSWSQRVGISPKKLHRQKSGANSPKKLEGCYQKTTDGWTLGRQSVLFKALQLLESIQR